MKKFTDVNPPSQNARPEPDRTSRMFGPTPNPCRHSLGYRKSAMSGPAPARHLPGGGSTSVNKIISDDLCKKMMCGLEPSSPSAPPGTLKLKCTQVQLEPHSCELLKLSFDRWRFLPDVTQLCFLTPGNGKNAGSLHTKVLNAKMRNSLDSERPQTVQFAKHFT